MKLKLQDIRDNWGKFDSPVIQDAIKVERNTYNSINFRLPDNEVQQSINHIQNFCNGHLYEELFLEYYGHSFAPIGEKGIWTDEPRPTRGEPDIIHKETGIKFEFKCYNMPVEQFIATAMEEHWFDWNCTKLHNAKHFYFCARCENYRLYHFEYNVVEHKWYYEISKLSTLEFRTFMNKEVNKRSLKWWSVQ